MRSLYRPVVRNVVTVLPEPSVARLMVVEALNVLSPDWLTGVGTSTPPASVTRSAFRFSVNELNTSKSAVELVHSSQMESLGCGTQRITWSNQLVVGKSLSTGSLLKPEFMMAT